MKHPLLNNNLLRIQYTIQGPSTSSQIAGLRQCHQLHSTNLRGDKVLTGGSSTLEAIWVSSSLGSTCPVTQRHIL